MWNQQKSFVTNISSSSNYPYLSMQLSNLLFVPSSQDCARSTTNSKCKVQSKKKKLCENPVKMIFGDLLYVVKLIEFNLRQRVSINREKPTYNVQFPSIILSHGYGLWCAVVLDVVFKTKCEKNWPFAWKMHQSNKLSPHNLCALWPVKWTVMKQ